MAMSCALQHTLANGWHCNSEIFDLQHIRQLELSENKKSGAFSLQFFLPLQYPTRVRRWLLLPTLSLQPNKVGNSVSNKHKILATNTRCVAGLLCLLKQQIITHPNSIKPTLTCGPPYPHIKRDRHDRPLTHEPYHG